MRKLLIVLAGLSAILVALLLALHYGHTSAGDLAMTKREESAASIGSGEVPPEQSGRGPRATEGKARVRFSRELLAQGSSNADEANTASALASKGRDPAYEQLLAKQGRDRGKEEQLLSRVTEVFGEKEDTSVGEIVCSAEFCRVELRAFKNVDLIKKYGYDVNAALDPKGFNFAVFSRDAAGNPVTNFYFGRDDSWRVPDFHALGLL